MPGYNSSTRIEQISFVKHFLGILFITMQDNYSIGTIFEVTSTTNLIKMQSAKTILL